LNSISIPAISSGIFNFPKDLCAKILFQTAIDFCEGNPKTVNEIRFTNFDAKTVEIFAAEFKKRFGDGSTPIVLGKGGGGGASNNNSTNTTTTTTTTPPPPGAGGEKEAAEE